jgi:hypothetical protein
VDETRLQQAEATVTRLRAWDAGLEMADVALGIAADLEAIRSKAATLNSMAESYGRRFYGMQDIPAVPRPLVSRATLREIYPTLTSVIGLETERAIGMPERVLAMMDLARLGLDMGAYLAEMDRDQVRVGPVLAVQNRVHHEIKSAAEALNDALRQQVQEVAA